MPVPLTLNKGDIVSLKVTNIKPTGKVVNKQTGTFHQYYITMEDKKGDFATCEYLSIDVEQDKFYLGVMQYVEVKYLSPKGTPEIEPCEPSAPSGRVAIREVPGKVVAPGNTSHIDLPGVKEVAAPNCYSVPASGKAITFAMGYAKDLKVAEIATMGRKVTREDVEEVCAWADIINDKICERLSF